MPLGASVKQVQDFITFGTAGRMASSGKDAEAVRLQTSSLK